VRRTVPAEFAQIAATTGTEKTVTKTGSKAGQQKDQK
jgi:hypothetical protein